MATAPAGVRVAAAAEVTSRSDGVLQTIQEAMSQGAITYRDGQVVREPLGIGATVLTFGGVQRQMLPGPVGDLETARLASGAANVVAYIANPAAPPSSGGAGSYTWAEVAAPDGHIAVAELVAGEGVQPPPSPPKRPGAFWLESRPARGLPVSCSVPPLSPTPPGPRSPLTDSRHEYQRYTAHAEEE